MCKWKVGTADTAAKAKPNVAIGSSAKCPMPPIIGTIQLLKVKFDTDYDVCSDLVEDFDDYKNFYILESGGKIEYHWLAASERKNANDKAKPANLPITIHSNKTLKFTASFKVEDGKSVPVNPIIKIKEYPDLKFTFNKPIGKTSGLFEVTFTATNLPYKDTVQHVPNFLLTFVYSIDGQGTWLDAGTSTNELYITWKEFDITSLFESEGFAVHGKPVQPIPKTTMQLKCTKTGGKYYILESLLFIGCKNATGKGKNEEEILDAIFVPFEGRNVSRKNETFPNGMGYWRNISAASTFNMPFRGTRSLVKFGEARCGEFKSFFNHLAFTQGIINMGEVAIASIPGIVAFSYSKEHHEAVAKQDAALLKDYMPYFILVKNCKMKPQAAKPLVIENFELSAAQGNNDAVNVFNDHVFSRHETSGRFYDASYGIGKSYFNDKKSSTLDNYCNKMLDGLFFVGAGGPYDVVIRHWGSSPVFNQKVKYKTVTTNAYTYLMIGRKDVL